MNTASASLPPRAGLSLLWLALLAFAAFSAVAALRAAVAIRAHTGVPASAAPARRTAGQVRPAPMPSEAAAPAKGVTGTIALPPLPGIAGSYVAGREDGTVRPAAPFRFGGASASDRGRALDCLADAIYYEAASESDDGQRAVAQVVLNRVRHPAFPATVCGVVFQGSARSSGCQFSFACDGAMARVPSRAGWARAVRIAGAALAGYVFAPVGLATHYHTYAVTPAWNRQLVMTAAIGAHFFHRWQGWWGTPAAFRQVYAGGEPMPGPAARAPVMASVAAMTALPLAPAAAPVTATETIQPAYAASGQALPAAVATPPPNNLPAASAILDRWKDSGKPLR